MVHGHDCCIDLLIDYVRKSLTRSFCVGIINVTCEKECMYSLLLDVHSRKVVILEIVTASRFIDQYAMHVMNFKVGLIRSFSIWRWKARFDTQLPSRVISLT